MVTYGFVIIPCPTNTLTLWVSHIHVWGKVSSIGQLMRSTNIDNIVTFCSHSIDITLTLFSLIKMCIT